MDLKFFESIFLEIKKITKNLSPPSFFKQSSPNFQETFLIIEVKNVTLEF